MTMFVYKVINLHKSVARGGAGRQLFLAGSNWAFSFEGAQPDRFARSALSPVEDALSPAEFPPSHCPESPSNCTASISHVNSWLRKRACFPQSLQPVDRVHPSQAHHSVFGASKLLNDGITSSNVRHFTTSKAFHTARVLQAALSRAERRYLERLEARKKKARTLQQQQWAPEPEAAVESIQPLADPPEITQPLQGGLQPRNDEEVKLVNLLARPDLIVTRSVELGNILLGFEQQSQYTMIDPRHPSQPVGYIVEDSNVFLRQILRSRRPFVAKVLDAAGNEICQVRRPFFWINSTIYVEVNGKVIGEAHRRWHLWKRNYDLYTGDNQFAEVNNWGFWWWTFELRGAEKELLGIVDRNWRGFGYELLTDAGQYVVRFGDVTGGENVSEARVHQELDQQQGLHMKLVETSSADSQLDVARPLTLTERAVALALAASLDSDYFSRTRGSFLPFPIIGDEVRDSQSDDATAAGYQEPTSPEGSPPSSTSGDPFSYTGTDDNGDNDEKSSAEGFISDFGFEDSEAEEDEGSDEGLVDVWGGWDGDGGDGW